MGFSTIDILFLRDKPMVHDLAFYLREFSCFTYDESDFRDHSPFSASEAVSNSLYTDSIF